MASQGTTTQRGYGWSFQKVRPLVLERDGHRCQVQLPGCIGIARAVDHIVPGGTATMDNLRAACVPCNSRRARRRRSRVAGPAAPLASASVTW